MRHAGRGKVDRDIRVAELGLASKAPGHLFHPLRLGRDAEVAGGRDGRDVEHVGDEVVVRIEGGTTVAGGPSVLEKIGGRAQMDVGVDERAAAPSGSLHDRHLAAGPDVEQALADRRVQDAVLDVTQGGRLAVGDLGDILRGLEVRFHHELVVFEFLAIAHGVVWPLGIFRDFALARGGLALLG